MALRISASKPSVMRPKTMNWPKGSAAMILNCGSDAADGVAQNASRIARVFKSHLTPELSRAAKRRRLGRTVRRRTMHYVTAHFLAAL